MYVQVEVRGQPQVLPDYFFETGSLIGSLSIYSAWETSVVPWSTCLYLPNAEITGAWPPWTHLDSGDQTEVMIKAQGASHQPAKQRSGW